MNPLKHLLLDMETRGLIFATANMQTAVLLSQGFMNAQLFTLVLTPARAKLYAHINFDTDLIVLAPDLSFIPIPEHLKTEGFLLQRELARKRAQYIEKTLLSCISLWPRSASGYSNEIFAEIQFELEKCHPEESYFTEPIHDYADILEI